MSYCPFCKKPIEKYWSYCHNCNKPLIIDFKDQLSLDKSVLYEIESHEGKGINEYEIREEDETTDDLKEIERKLSFYEKSGKNMGQLLLKKASLYYKRRDFFSALKNLNLALQNFEEDNDKLNMAICHNELGLINEEVGYYDQAIYHFDRAIEILRLIGDNQKLIQVLNNTGNVYHILSDLEQSYTCYQKALDLAENQKLELDAVKSASNLVEVLFSLKDYDRILRILKNNLDFFSANHDLYGTILTLLKYGKVYYYIGEGYYDQAYHYLNDSLALIKRIESQLSPITKARLEWECYLYMGKLNILWDNDNEAEDYLLKSLEKIRTYEIQDHINEALVLENLANFYSIKGDDKKSIDYFMLVIDIYKKYGNKVKIAGIQKIIANIFKEYLQDIDKAKSFYETALDLYESEHYYKQAAEILHILADIDRDANNLESAINYYKRASNYYSELNDEYNQSIILQKIKSLNKVERDL